jgi:hypothetical protein
VTGAYQTRTYSSGRQKEEVFWGSHSISKTYFEKGEYKYTGYIAKFSMFHPQKSKTNGCHQK